MQNALKLLRFPTGSFQRVLVTIAQVLLLVLLASANLVAESPAQPSQPSAGPELLPALQPDPSADAKADAPLVGEIPSPNDVDSGLPACCDCPPRPDDQFWYFSSRHLCGGCCPPTGDPELRVWRHDNETECRQPATLDEFFASDDPEAVTCIYVHGARVTEQVAFSRLHDLHRAIACGLPADVKLRMVCYSWPNSRSIRVLRDFRTAYNSVQPHCYYLGWLVSRIDPQVKVSLLSFSLGAQVIGGGLHVLAGGNLQGWSIDSPPRATPTRVVLWTAAENNLWLLPGNLHGRALDVVDGMLLINNRCDPVLKRYRWMERRLRYRPAALGYAGLPCCTSLGRHAGKIEQYNASGSLGISHAFQPHIDSHCIMGLTRPYLLWQELPGD